VWKGEKERRKIIKLIKRKVTARRRWKRSRKIDSITIVLVECERKYLRKSAHSIIYESLTVPVEEEIQLRARTMDSKGKVVEKLVISTVRPKVKSREGRPENEQINTAVMKVLQGYDWTLVPAAIK
jgi:Sox developmental protein N terminal